jgi:hypothetical protein
LCYNAENISPCSPTIDSALVVSDLYPFSGDRFDQMEILNSIHLAKNNIPNGELVLPHWSDCNQLTALDLPRHAVPSGPEFYELASLQHLDVFACPTHLYLVLSIFPATADQLKLSPT